MRFSKIVINNYRQYRKITFDFPKQTDFDMHIIEAQNGIGKTTLLNAINWCLYGDEPHVSGGPDTKADKLPLCNMTTLQDAKERDISTCEVSVVIFAEEGGAHFEISRSAVFNTESQTQKGQDHFEISKTISTGTSLLEDELAEAEIERYFPKSIRQYFWFDGEQLLYYFDPSYSQIASIKSSIFKIAGVNTLDRIEDHLSSMIRDLRKEIAKKSPELEEKNPKYEHAQEKTVQISDEIDQLNEQIAQAKKRIDEIGRAINGSEGLVEKNQRLEANEARIEKLKETDLQQAYIARATFILKYSNLLFLYDKNVATENYIQEREQADKTSADVNLNAIKASLDEDECKLCHRELTPELIDELNTLVQKYENNASLRTLAEIKQDVHRSLNISEYKDEKAKIIRRISETEAEIQKLVKEDEDLKAAIRVGGDDLMDERDRLQSALNINLQKIGKDKGQLDICKVEEQKALDEFNKAKDANKEADELKDQLNVAEKALTVIAETKEELVDDVKKRLQQKTWELFEQLEWKKNTYGRVALDEDFNLKLFDAKTDQSCLSSCSAAEKELLALSFTIALHQVSEYDNLLFIDTPVSRVSDENRKNFAQVLLEVSRGKQIILAFTPSDYSREISDVLDRTVISSFSELRTDSAESVTSIK